MRTDQIFAQVEIADIQTRTTSYELIREGGNEHVRLIPEERKLTKTATIPGPLTSPSDQTFLLKGVD